MAGVVSHEWLRGHFLFYSKYPIDPNFPVDVDAMVYVFFLLVMAEALIVPVLASEAT
jgi:hypothetical protein